MFQVLYEQISYIDVVLHYCFDYRILFLRKLFGPDAELYLVGGCVRDAFLGNYATDVDVATRLSPEEIENKFLAADLHNFCRINKKYNTVEWADIEITTFRGGSIEEDLKLRDFTMNSLAVRVEDLTVWSVTETLPITLERVLIDAPIDPKTSFTEDPIRILRGIRIACEQKDPRLWEWSDVMEEALSKYAHLLAFAAPERIKEEFIKILMSPNASMGLWMCMKYGLFWYFLAEVINMKGCEQNHYHELDVWEHTLAVVDHCPPDLTIRLAAFFHDIGKPLVRFRDDKDVWRFHGHEVVSAEIAEAVMKRLTFASDLTSDVCKLVSEHMRSVDGGPKSIRRLIADLGDLLPKFKALWLADALSAKPNDINRRREIQAEYGVFQQKLMVETLRNVTEPYLRLAIDGNDVMSFGVPQGPKVGKVLKEIADMVIDDPKMNDRATLMLYLEREICHL